MRTKTFKRIELGRYDIPEESLKLTEDIVRLEQIITLLDKIDPANCDHHFTLRSTAISSHQSAKRHFKLKFLSR